MAAFKLSIVFDAERQLRVISDYLPSMRFCLLSTLLNAFRAKAERFSIELARMQYTADAFNSPPQ